MLVRLKIFTMLGSVCGNNIIEPGEICDGTFLNGQIFTRLSSPTYYWVTYKTTCSIIGNYYADPTGPRGGIWKLGGGSGVSCGTRKACDGKGNCVIQ